MKRYLASFLRENEELSKLLGINSSFSKPKLTLTLYYQTVVNAGQDIIFAEVLFEIHKDGQKLNMEKVSNLLEKHDHIAALDITNLQNLCKHIRKFKYIGENPKYPYSINISGRTIEQHHEKILTIVQDIADWLIIEITERVRMNLAIAELFSKKFRALGGIIALDDFNEKTPYYSEIYSFSLLERTQAQIVKLIIPKNADEVSDFYKVVNSIKEIAPKVLLTLEKIEHEYELITLDEELPGSLFQGYYTSQMSCIIENQTIEY